MPRVVVIDDEEVVGELTGAVLGMKGYDVRVASSGETGIRLVRESLPDAVVCDVRMPVIGGAEVILALRSHPATKHIPVLLMSGQCDPGCISMGDAFLQKPFNVAELLATLERFCAEGRPIKAA
jgi:CheY-like chemotaxis protein